MYPAMLIAPLLLALGTGHAGHTSSVQQSTVTSTSVPTIDPKTWTTEGAAIPDLELPRVDGDGTVSLASFRGKKLLLIQFASW